MKRLLLLLLLLAAPASAEVRTAAPEGFELEARVIVAATPAETYKALAEVDRWWNREHTYSGDSRNLRLKARAGGCFCEHIPQGGGTVEHGRVVYARPGKTLRLQGGLGPLQAEAALGILTWSLKAVPGGTEVTQAYVVGGFVRGGADKLAPIVDQVLAGQLARLKAYLAD